MKCPYRKKIRVSPDGVCRVTEVDYMECLKESCPYYGALAFDVKRNSWVMGCRKAAKECES